MKKVMVISKLHILLQNVCLVPVGKITYLIGGILKCNFMGSLNPHPMLHTPTVHALLMFYLATVTTKVSDALRPQNLKRRGSGVQRTAGVTLGAGDERGGRAAPGFKHRLGAHVAQGL